MDVKHIEYIIELARTGNLTQTAANLGVAQPSISQAITSLERHFGIVLFDRTSRPVLPTPAGRTFIEQSTRVLDELKALRNIATDHSALLRGRLRIGTTFLVGEAILPPLLIEFHAQYPGITFVLRREPLIKLIDGVRGGDFDVAFVDTPKTSKLQDLECHTFHVDEIVLVVPPKHPLATRTSIRLSEIGAEPFIAHEIESSMYAPFSRAAKAEGFVPNVIASTQSQAILRSLVSRGLGISVGSQTFFENAGPPVQTVRLSPHIRKETMLVLRSGDANNVTRPFVEFIRARLGM